MVDTLAKLLTGSDLNACLAIGNHGHESQGITAATETFRLNSSTDVTVATGLRQSPPRDVNARSLDRAFRNRAPQPPIGASHIAHRCESPLESTLQQTSRTRR